MPFLFSQILLSNSTIFIVQFQGALIAIIITFLKTLINFHTKSKNEIENKNKFEP